MAVPARRVRQLPSKARPRLTPVPGRSRRSSPRRRGRRRQAPFVLFALLVMASMVVLLTSAQALVAQGSFRLSDLTQRADRLEAEYDRLRLRVAELSSPGRIEAAARRAGLVLPGRVETLVVHGGRG